MKIAFLALAMTPFAGLAAEPFFPSAEGTTWKYDWMQEKSSEGFDLTEPNEQEQVDVTYRLGATEKIDNQELRRLEIYRGDALESVDLIAIEENGIVCPARTDDKGGMTKLIPPQKMLALPLSKGTRWIFDGTIGETKVVQRYEITGEEDVDLPAGKFHAWRIHCEQTAPKPATIDRWFVAGTGFVKVETALKGESGSTLQKTTLILKEPPKVAAIAIKNVRRIGQEFSAGVSNQASGELKTEFKSDTPEIFARWHGSALPDKAEVRAVFIAENVADISADYQIDESTTTTPASNASGSFTLSKPEDGWAPGNYRVEFFINDELAQTAKFKIVK